VRLKRFLRAAIGSACVAALAAPTSFAESPPALQRLPGSALSVSVAQSGGFSRIEFRFPGARMTSRRKGQTLILHFDRYARPDMTRLRVDPPRWLKGAAERNAGGLEITLELADDADANVGSADGATFVNLYAKAGPPPPATPAAATATDADVRTRTPLSVRPDPTPASGVVRLQAQMVSGHVVLQFGWKHPLGAAVFRRGDSVWVVFDTPARIDVSGAPHGFRQVGAVQAVQGADFSAVRITSPSDVGLSAAAQGAAWIVTLGAGQPSSGEPIRLGRDEAATSPALAAAVAGATRVVWIDDPVVGDHIGVVTAMAPCKGLLTRRAYVDLALLPTVQGLVIQPRSDRLAVSTDGDVVRIAKAGGLDISPRWAAPAAHAQNDGPGLPQAMARPALIDFDAWPETGAGGFVARYDDLQRGAADEASQGKDAPMAARMGLARFLVGSDLSFEAIGVLNMIARSRQTMLGDAEFRGLRGAAKVMAGRYNEAETDLSAPMLADDPSSSLWRGYIDASLGQWVDARREFDAGAAMLFQFPAKWRSRFATANAEAAIALEQYPLAEVAIENALRDQHDPVEQLQTRLVQARLLQAQGQLAPAQRVYEAIARVNLDYLAAPALLHATELKLARSQLTPIQAANTYEALRYRWRGDATELETIRALGQIYLNLGRYREALAALRSAGQRLPDLPQALELQSDLSGAFRVLFLDGQADGLQPIQALALFYDFKELTPIGADGDLMVRKLARRLVDVDLLSQAADLLKYQADNRLNGVPRAEVDTDLALIELMNRRPEAALDAINSSRSTLLPSALSGQRRLIEARAWLGLGKSDHALEIIQSDRGAEADQIRAEVAWKQRNWALAAGDFEKQLGDRYKASGPLADAEETRLLRAAIAFSLAGDEAGLARLRGRYQGFIDQAHQADALRVALSGAQDPKMAVGDFGRVSAEDVSFVGWIQAMKQRFRDRPAPTSATSGLSLPPAGASPARAAAPSKTAEAKAAPSKG
jgi:tetratricopeptide (TPR) repeat protein